MKAPHYVVSKSVNTVACCVKLRVPDELAHRLSEIYPLAESTARQMLKRRDDTSSKHWRLVPCVVAKSLSAKYQRNPKCNAIRRVVIPICSDKGKQIKPANGGLRIPALFKKAVLTCEFPRPIVGHVRQIEFFRRGGRWFGSVCYNTPCAPRIDATGCIGVDRNSVGNVAVIADPNNGNVRHLGFNPARTKSCWRGRKKNLQRQGKRRLLSKLRKNHARRSTYQNHVVSKSVVDYAKKHSRAIAIEKLAGVRSKDSKIRSYSERNQWAFAQLATFINYKARLAGVPVVEVDPAYTSQTCSRCGHIHKPDGKLFRCPTCGHQDHRDSNAAFVIARRGNDVLGGLAKDSVRRRSGLLMVPVLGSGAAT